MFQSNTFFLCVLFQPEPFLCFLDNINSSAFLSNLQKMTLPRKWAIDKNKQILHAVNYLAYPCL